VNATSADRHWLEAIVLDRGAPQKSFGAPTSSSPLRRLRYRRNYARTKPVVWRWQARFMAEGVEGLTRDKTRTPGKRPLSTDTVQRVVDLALGPPPGEENPLLLDPPIATGRRGRKLRC
jgi:hypothetical protein